MTINKDIEFLMFKCDNGHRWKGTFFPKSSEGVGILEGSWKCPKCNMLGTITFVECPDSNLSEPRPMWLIPIDKQILINENFTIKTLLDIARQLIEDTLRYKFGSMSTHRIFDTYPTLDNIQDINNYDKEALTKVWQLQDILDLIEEKIED